MGSNLVVLVFRVQLAHRRQLALQLRLGTDLVAEPLALDDMSIIHFFDKCDKASYLALPDLVDGEPEVGLDTEHSIERTSEHSMEHSIEHSMEHSMEH